ncbi:hypothetical protein ISCGN_014264 [Ixodes scapularis]
MDGWMNTAEPFGSGGSLRHLAILFYQRTAFAAARTRNMVFKPDEERRRSARNAKSKSGHSIAREKCVSASRRNGAPVLWLSSRPSSDALPFQFLQPPLVAICQLCQYR